MRVIFFGSGSFALPTLQALCGSSHQVAAVITQPPRPAGRGTRLRPTLIASAARAAGLEVHEAENVNCPDLVQRVGDIEPDVEVVVEFGQKILAPMRQAAKFEAFNLHGSLLPQLRGAGPVNWAIIRGYETTGVTTFRLVDRMDAGPIYLTRQVAIGRRETAEQLRLRLAELGAQLVLETLGQMSANWSEPSEQDEDQATHAPRLSREDGRLDFAEPADALRCRINGTYPWPGAHARFISQQRSGPIDVVLARADSDDQPLDAPAGTVDPQHRIATGKGSLEILEIKPAGKRLMDWKDFANGYRVRPGDRFETL
ncbi:MAG: methionyl-tRNA formyltransferase [Phycisphaerae bacterium]